MDAAEEGKPFGRPPRRKLCKINGFRVSFACGGASHSCPSPTARAASECRGHWPITCGGRRWRTWCNMGCPALQTSAQLPQSGDFVEVDRFTNALDLGRSERLENEVTL